MARHLSVTINYSSFHLHHFWLNKLKANVGCDAIGTLSLPRVHDATAHSVLESSVWAAPTTILPNKVKSRDKICAAPYAIHLCMRCNGIANTSNRVRLSAIAAFKIQISFLFVRHPKCPVPNWSRILNDKFFLLTKLRQNDRNICLSQILFTPLVAQVISSFHLASE